MKQDFGNPKGGYSVGKVDGFETKFFGWGPFFKIIPPLPGLTPSVCDRMIGKTYPKLPAPLIGKGSVFPKNKPYPPGCKFLDNIIVSRIWIFLTYNFLPNSPLKNIYLLGPVPVDYTSPIK